MNTFADYKDLKDNIVDWMDRQDIEYRVPTFLRLISVDVARELRIPPMEKTTIVPVYADGTAIVPEDLVEVRSVKYIQVNSKKEVTSRIALNRGSVSKFDKSRQSTETYDVKPDSFTIVENYFKIYPLPYVQDTVENYQSYNNAIVGHIEVSYYSIPHTINEDGEENWILEVAPDIYFYGGMMHANRFTRNFEEAAYWEQKYEKAIKELQGSVNISEWAGGPIVVED